MACTEFLKARVSSDIKRQAKAVADRELMSEATWLKRLVVRELRSAHRGTEGGGHETSRVPARGSGQETSVNGGSVRPILVRLRSDDRLLLDARAEARGMRPATYAAVVLRSHLNKLTPLPKEELLALKRSIAELASIGRNINQIAQALHDGGKAPGSVREEFRAMLKICEALRDHTKALVMSNVASWESGDA